MNTPERLSPDDPRLTLYALGEMEPAERPAFEALLAQDPAARAAVEEIRRTAALLGTALEQETVPTTDNVVEFPRESVREVGIVPPQGGRPGQHDGGPLWPDEYVLKKANKWLRFPASYFTIAGLAAACFGVFFVLHESEEQTRRQQELAAREAMLQARVASVSPAAMPPPPEAFASALADQAANSARAAEAAPAAAKRAQPVAAAAARPSGIRMAVAPAGVSVADRFVATAENTVSTLPLRVGRESYSAVRQQLRQRQRPARETVQVAELVNAFSYAWPAPETSGRFSLLLEESAAPWSGGTRVLRVGVRAVGESGAVVARGAVARVEFDPVRVRAWRLIGFERDDGAMQIGGLSAGETLRAGDAVVAVYELLPVEEATLGPVATLAVEYREPAAGAVRQVSRAVEGGRKEFAQASADQRFASAVVAFGLALRQSPEATASWPEIARWAESGAGEDGARREFVELVQVAEALDN
jgi:hypothetical protein